MRTNKKRMWLLIIFCFLTQYTYATDSSVVQLSTAQALLKGIYDGETTFEQLKKWGNFGMGTLNGLDGEMVAIEGQFYIVKGDGSVHLIHDKMKTPYATVHFFQADQTVTLTTPIQNYIDFQNHLDQYLPSRNRPYAFKITGTFDELKTRSVYKQKPPYPPAIEVIADQSVFEFKNITGTAVGYWFPDYLEKLTVPGYHLHFLSEDKQHGGHILNCRLSKGTVAIDWLNTIKLVIPQDSAFHESDFSRYHRTEIEAVKRGSIKEQ
jgi:acetolactate decarboxylase